MSYNASVADADLDHILDKTANLWSDLAGSRLFITGGTGFFGIWLLESIAAANRKFGKDIRATVLSREPRRFATQFPHLGTNPAFDWIADDVRHFNFPQGEFSHIIHAATAASATLNTSAPGEMFSVIVDGTRHVLDFAAQAGTRKLLFASSGAIYGAQPPDMERLQEDYSGGPDPCRASSAYGEGKRAAELLCAIASNSTLEIKLARGFAFVGPHLPFDAHFAIGNFIRDALAGHRIKVNGDGSPYRSYLYAADMAVWLWHLLLRGQPMRPYNLGSDQALSIAELAHAVARHAGNSPVEIAKPPAPGSPSRYVPDISRAKREMGLGVLIDLNEALSRTMRWAAESR